MGRGGGGCCKTLGRGHNQITPTKRGRGRISFTYKGVQDNPPNRLPDKKLQIMTNLKRNSLSVLSRFVPAKHSASGHYKRYKHNLH